MTPRWLELGQPHVWRPYTQMKTAGPPLPVSRTEGVRLHLEDGRVLIDGVASWWTACHGYNHPHLMAAVREQLERLPHVMLGGLAHEQPYRLASRLARLLPGDLRRVFFAESGSVAVEIAMKMAIQYAINRNQRGRTRFLSFRGGYHGDTLATMSICDPEEGMHAHFSKVFPEQHVIDLPTGGTTELDELLRHRGHEIAAIIVEPLVQGAGGMLFHDPIVLSRLRAAADRHGCLLIFDEIFTGFGRAGSLFALEQAGVVPDIVTLSKALTGGVAPLSAAIAREHVFEAFWSDDPAAALMHGPTYMAHALGCAAANASLDLFETGAWRGQVSRIAAQMTDELAPCANLPGVREVRVKGAIGVVELNEPIDPQAMMGQLVERGVWVKPFGKIVYLTPAFIISESELTQLTSAIVSVLSA